MTELAALKHPPTFIVQETTGFERKLALVQLGVPFPMGFAYHKSDLTIVTQNTHSSSLSESSVISPNKFEVIVNAYWHDGSIKWAFIICYLDIAANQTLYARVINQTEQFESSLHRELNEPPKHDTIKTKLKSDVSTHFGFNSIHSSQLNVKSDNLNCDVNLEPFSIELHKKNKLESKSESERLCIDSLACTGLLGERFTCQFKTIEHQDLNSLAELYLKGEVLSEESVCLALFELKIILPALSNKVECQLTLHNPRAAQHINGLWDLGDENAFKFKTFSLKMKHSNAQCLNIKLGSEIWRCDDDLVLHQASSGGENWQSPIHVNVDNCVELPYKGFKLTQASNTLKEGDRAEPIVEFVGEQLTCYWQSEQFWQNFPKALRLNKNAVDFDIFPDTVSANTSSGILSSNTVEAHELQPGEQKTHFFSLALVDASTSDVHDSQASTLECTPALLPQLSVYIAPSWLARTNTLPHFSSQPITDDPISQIIQKALDSPNHFFDKRETIDAFGWRHFGELYADHETLGYEGDKPFVSHYNNQYDPIYGFLRQWFYTQDPRWLNLANDLAQHVKDIDIYNTDLDKAEYNNGLFWHTDHYLPAETATHRTYSKHHEIGAYDGHMGGGGPGGQHCYTTGLMLHYFITNNDSSKSAVLKLTNWISQVYDGNQSLFDWLLRLKNSNAIGFRSFLTGQYPLDRGVANYINALLDSFQLTNDFKYLARVNEIIRHTIHPNEDLTLRDLCNVELCWFYTVFLQAVIRFLQEKEALQALDDDFYYARDALLHFTDWMLDNETPYLDKPEILEYPNHTWAAQDLRKANIFYYAAYFSVDTLKQTALIKKAEFFNQYVSDSIANEETRYFTRLQVLLMQNHGCAHYFNEMPSEIRFEPIRQHPKIQYDTQCHKIKWVLKTGWTRLKCFSLTRELTWLSRRSAKVAKLLGNRY